MESGAAASASSSSSATAASASPPTPKRMNAYLLYAQSARASLIAAHPDLKITEITKRMAAQWKALDADAKPPFEARAAELKATLPPTKRNANKRNANKRNADDADGDDDGEAVLRRPRAPSAFILYANSVRAGLRAADPAASIAQLGSRAGAQWRALTAEQKQPFVDDAARRTAALASEPAATAKPKATRTKRGKGKSKGKGKGKGKGENADAAADAEAAATKVPRAPSAYLLFVTEQQQSLRASTPGLSATEYVKRAAAAWKALDAAAKQPYVDRAAAAKADRTAAVAAAAATKDNSARAVDTAAGTAAVDA